MTDWVWGPGLVGLGGLLEGPGAMESVHSSHFVWHRRAGVFLAVRYLNRHQVPVVDTPMAELPQLSKRVVGFALRLLPHFLDRADLTFPIIVAGRGKLQIALDGRHRISKAIWTGATQLPTVRVPLWYALEILIPGIFEVEWLALALRGELRKAGRRHRSHPEFQERTGEPEPS